jgi:hypothetical protein
VAILRFIRDWLGDLAATLRPCRFGVIALLFGVLLLMATDQGQEALRALAQQDDPTLHVVQWILFFIAATTWALNAWYWARQHSNVQFAASPPPSPRLHAMRVAVPRILGCAAFLAIGAALWKASSVAIDSVAWHAAARELRLWAGLSFALAVLFYAFTRYRRVWFNLPTLGPRVTSVALFPPATWWALAGSAAAALILFLAFVFVPLHIGPTLGTPAIALFAASAWIPFGTTLTFLASRYDFPALIILVLLAVLFSAWNDNHALRTVPAARSPARTVDQYLDEWLSQRKAEITAQDTQRYPVFVVAAAGGGIRAAYWSATLLAAIEDRHPGVFSRHTVALSGVSGGSLGIATYLALTVQNRAKSISACRRAAPGPLQSCAMAMMSEDFLAPTAGSLLYPDLVQRFLPWPIPAFDRAVTLEKAWEKAWTDQGLPNERFSRPLEDLWTADSDYSLPLLLLNGTVVESGHRVVAAPVPLAGALADTLDLRAATGSSVRLSTAAHLSARFTYVSPPATLHDANGSVIAHGVDGGYFENSGATTASELVLALLRAADRQNLRNRIAPYVILISNDPGNPPAASVAEQPPMRWLTEVLAPLNALLNARDARGRLAEDAARTTAEAYSGAAIRFWVTDSQVPLPLGWMLSDSARHELDHQLTTIAESAGDDNSFVAIDRLLR